MGTAYTPGLTITPSAIIRRARRLPIKGRILVERGQTVAPNDVVARALLPGIMQSVKAAAMLGVDPADLAEALRIKIGDEVQVGQMIAESKGLFGLFKTEAKSPVGGTVETISKAAGSVGIRQAPIPVDLKAYIRGEIAEILPEEGVIVETRGALAQGIFGIGGERCGELRLVCEAPDQILTAEQIQPDFAGKIIIGGSLVTGDALKIADAMGVAGIIAGGIVDTELIAFLGYDIGVAITGHEKINTTLVITEGFGRIPMAQRTFDLLASLAGREASINGATQIRAGVIRPEIIIPHEGAAISSEETDDDFSLRIGSAIRIIREPYFGELATVTALPLPLATVESGAQVRVLEAETAGGERVVVPRANVEIMAG